MTPVYEKNGIMFLKLILDYNFECNLKENNIVSLIRERRRLHNEELNDLYSPSNIVRVIKSRRIRWAGHVARVGEEREGVDGLGGETGGKETTRET